MWFQSYPGQWKVCVNWSQAKVIAVAFPYRFCSSVLQVPGPPGLGPIWWTVRARRTGGRHTDQDSPQHGPTPTETGAPAPHREQSGAHRATGRNTPAPLREQSGAHRATGRNTPAPHREHLVMQHYGHCSKFRMQSIKTCRSTFSNPLLLTFLTKENQLFPIWWILVYFLKLFQEPLIKLIQEFLGG